MASYRLALGGALIAGMICSSAAWGQSSLSALHKALNLNANQDLAWNAYQATAATQTRARRQAAAEMFPRLNAPQRMDLVEAEMKQELADLRLQSQTLKAFYATLSVEQQRVFDADTLARENAGQSDQ